MTVPVVCRQKKNLSDNPDGAFFRANMILALQQQKLVVTSLESVRRVKLPGDIVRVNEGEEALGEGDGVADEGGQLAVVGLGHQDAELLAQLVAPALAQLDKVLRNRSRPR